jgi:hypothetical protein
MPDVVHINMLSAYVSTGKLKSETLHQFARSTNQNDRIGSDCDAAGRPEQLAAGYNVKIPTTY